ncbi:MAG: UvrABC system protein A [Alphaproteobacteria bacterium MarineAlpha5_Bin8]|nr:MAG: UvrABC system protein A [Alphaproteobacteria bacterium MarineAlpha5_Bin8]PPR52442.1 MAG: UvrABC system protein A [Alphaproteobacteria bacterium MarineAlpha5_Bin6]|tara:strand:+ start:25189 stop:28005 length:2817 start_codon:yes stop_codon:yes gene_type:complete
MILDKIIIKGAREHNLQNINLEIPKNKLVVITGVSGSGKSTLAFDTIYSEGQRKYVESLSAYARQFLQMMDKPDVDSIEGLSPAISIEQKTTQKNPRSTVGTVTEIYDYLRVLFARVGIPHSPATGLPIRSQSIGEITDLILENNRNDKIYILSPIVRSRKGEYKKEIEQLKKKGFQRLKIDNNIYEIDEVPNLKKNFKHNIEVLIDRLIINKNIKQRLAESVELGLNLSDGLIYVENLKNNKVTIYSSKFSCPVSGFTIEEIEPRLFSFNAPQGACEECDGLGIEKFYDEAKIIPDDSRSIVEGAIKPWETKVFGYQKKMFIETLTEILNQFKVKKNTPWKDISNKVKEFILYGNKNANIKKYNNFEGIVNFIEKKYNQTGRFWVQYELEKYLSERDCEVCQGYRLNEKALSVKIDNIHIGEITKKSINDSFKWFKLLDSKLKDNQKKIAEGIIKEISNRLNFLNKVGLDYLTLSRASKSLSGGESQRIRLASQIGSGLTGVLYVLDEPTIGLHQKDNHQLIETLIKLKNLGNTVIIVEHDEDMIKHADYIIDIGPKAGKNGGHIIAKGKLNEILNNKKSLTANYLNKKNQIEVPKKRKFNNSSKKVKLSKVKTNNLKNLEVIFPLGKFISVTGVSGSGKSSLIIDTLFQRLDDFYNKSLNKDEKNFNIKGTEHIDKIIDINQSPIGRTPRSNPATYTGCFTPIRDWYSGLNESKARGYAPGRFSFNVSSKKKGGRCEHCEGDGLKKIEMHFLADVYVECDVCKGKRYNRETLEVKYKDKSIADILDMTVYEGYIFFDKIPSIKQKLKTLMDVGLDYIKIGQSATTLSGGEAQRIKLSKELSKRSTGKTLYILDEPTTGLHFDDVKKLLKILHTLVDEGNTVIVIEHNLDVIKTSDYIIDLGPVGGEKGGYIVFEGKPEDIIKEKKSFTGKYLKNYI